MFSVRGGLNEVSVFYDGKEEKGMRGSSFKQCMASWRVYNGRHFKAIGDRSQYWPLTLLLPTIDLEGCDIWNLKASGSRI